ncbi:MAG: hypothetical protein V4592_08280 [Bacteroidota bacterium]
MKITTLSVCLLLLSGFTHAQTNTDPKAMKQRDSTVMKDIFEPMAAEAVNDNSAPDWNQLKSTLTAKYDAAFAERFTWKAKIYFDYSRDWPGFTGALVHYTNTYEDQNDLKLLNKNAGMILKYATDPKALEAALGWSKKTVEKEPGNADYKKTYDALAAKTGK